MLYLHRKQTIVTQLSKIAKERLRKMKKTSHLLTALLITALLSASHTVFATPSATACYDELCGEYNCTQQTKIIESAELSSSTVASGTCGENVTWTLDGEGTLTISGKGEMENYSPSVNMPWYDCRSSVKNVVMNEGVTSIGNYAFCSCTSLESVTLPKSLKKIGTYSFFECIPLDGITIPESVTTIGYGAFCYCNGFTSITIPNSVTFIDEQAFSDCTGLKSIEIPNGITSISYCMFQNCSSLTSITIPDSVTFIDDYAFSGCTSLTSVVIPTSVTSIKRTSFNNCKNVTIYASANSYAQTYATTYSIPFEVNPIKIDIGEKMDSANVRFIVQNGVAVKLEETVGNKQYTYKFGNDPNSEIVTIVEKTGEDTATVVKSQYYYIDATNFTVTKLDLDTYTQIYDETSVRVGSPVGLRFKAQILSFAKSETEDYEIAEYGFIIAKKSDLAERALSFDSGLSKYVYAPAYVKADGTNVIFDSSNDEYDLFTGVLYNIPEKQYKTDLACRTYTKIKIGENTFTLYGEVVYSSLYTTAQSAIVGTSDLTVKKALIDIISVADKTPMIDVGDMYN